MDNRLKQRLIGVAVVVALAVIIIPELVKEPVGPGSPAVTTPIPPRPVQEPPKPPDVTISLPQAAPPPAPVTPMPSPAPVAEVPPPHTPAPPQFPPDAATQLKPERPVKPVDVTEPVNPAEAEAEAKARLAREEAAKAKEAEAKARLAREQAAKAKAAKEAEVKARLAREEAAKAKAAKEAETKPEVAKVEPPKPEPLKTEIRKPEPPKPEVAKVEPPKPEPLKTEIRKPEPPKPIELPKLELIGRAGAPPVASAPASTARSDASDRGWIVQAGSFSLPENANVLRDKLRSQRFDAFVERIAAGGRTLYRVRVGPRTSRAQSEAIAARMQREAGVAGQVVSLND